jgi:nucleotide-binding universal stress UspA family protein
MRSAASGPDYLLPTSAPILIAYDPASGDRAPVRFAAAVAGFTGAPLQVASVYADDDVLNRLAGGQMAEDLPGDPGERLEEVVRDLRADGLQAEAVAIGAASVPRGVDLAAAQIGPALVVVGSAAGTPSGRLAPSSTAQRLLDGGPCAVVIVPAGWDAGPPYRTFAAGFVETPEGHDAVRGAYALADRSGATLRVITAVQARPWMAAEADRSAEDDLRIRAGAAAESAIASLLGARVDIDVAVEDPVDALLRVAGEVELLVCGSRCYGPTSTTLLGGVTRRLTAEAACPVIVTARAPDVRLEELIGA